MALEAVVFPQDLLGCNGKELRSLGGGGGGVWGYGFGGIEEKEIVCGGRSQEEAKGGVCGNSPWCSMVQNFEEFAVNSSSQETCTTTKEGAGFAVGQEVAVGRRKRRRTKSFKNKEEVENQRMTHIAVERNRRKQMNEYLAVLRSLMPPSYVQRGDQASIIGGAINFVKELEQLLQSLEAQRRIKQQSNSSASGGGNSSSPFAGFFSFPQYSSRSAAIPTANTSTASTNSTGEAVAENRSAVADIEVTMVESHANLKVLSRRRPKQVLKMVVGLQSLRLTALHLNVTTVDEMVLYSFSLKVEDDCVLTSVDEIATAVYQMVGKIQEEAGVI